MRREEAGARRPARGGRPLRRPGFTIIEVLAAFVIVAIVLPTVAQGISACVKAQAQARALAEASALAESKMAELVSFPGWESQTVSGDFSPEHPEYRWTAAAIMYDTYLEEVVVIVSWSDAMGERTWSLSTLLYYQGSGGTSGTGTTG